MSDTKPPVDLPEVSPEELDLVSRLFPTEKKGTTVTQLARLLDKDVGSVSATLRDLVDREIVLPSRLVVDDENTWYSPLSREFLAARAARSVASKGSGVTSNQRFVASRPTATNDWLEASDLGLMEESALNEGKPLTSHYLARQYFPNRMHFRRFSGLGRHNAGALCREMGAWEKNGVSPSTIKAMIDEFCKYREWCKGKIAWQVFLARREQLLDIVQHHQKEAESKANCTDKDYWLGRGKWAKPADPRVKDKDYWLGRGKYASRTAD